MNSKVEIKDNAFFINNKRTFIFSGEMHYFRIKKSQWQDRVRKAKKANLNTVSSYIPWSWHNFSESKFDFRGKSFPERDVVRFLEILKKEKMYFIARIGPVSNGEIIFDGLPKWLLEKYPNIKLKDYAGRTNPYSTLINYHHPKFLEKVNIWYDKLLPVLNEYLFENNGPIISIQLDNEISMLNWLTKTPNYSHSNTKFFQKFLESKYRTIKAVNRRFGTKYNDFSEIKQPAGDFNGKMGEFYFEWTEFYREYYALYYKKLYDMIQKYNVNLPMIANIPQIYDYDVKGRGNMGIMTTSMFKKFGKYVENIVFGGAYQYRRVDYENFTDITAMTEIVRMITPESNPLICAEMQTGVMFDRPVLYPSDVELNIKTSVGSGLNGINCYMFAGGVNYKNSGGFGDYHNWQSPVADDGKLAPHYESIKEVGELLSNFQNIIAEGKNIHEINIGLYLPYYQTEYLSGAFINELMNRRDTKFFDGLLRLIRLAGFNYKFINIMSIENEKLKKLKNLWVFSIEYMDKKTQKKIIEFIEAGGNTLFYPTIPEMDLNLKKCTVIKDFLKIRKISSLFGANKIKKYGKEYLYYGGDGIYVFDVNKNSKTKFLFLSEQNKAVSFLTKKNKAKILVAGFDFTHKFDYQIKFMEYFAGLLGIRKYIINDNIRLNIIMRQSNVSDILFVSNYTEIREFAKINIKSNPFPVDMNITVPGRKSLILFANYKLMDDLKLFFITAEITKVLKIKNHIELNVKNLNNEVLICYAGDYNITTSGRLKVLRKNKKYVYVSVASSKEQLKISFSR